MELKVTVYAREHAGGTYTVQVLGDSELEIYTASLPRAFEELELLLGDRVERTHPSRQASLAFLEDAELSTLEVPEAILVEGETETGHAAANVSVLRSENRAWQSLLFPWLGLRLFIPKKDPWKKAALDLLTQHFKSLSPHQRLEARGAVRDFVESVVVHAEPPKLSQFTGLHRDADMLPPAAPKDEEEEKKDPLEKKRPPTPTLEKLGTHLSRLAKDRELEHAHGREREVEDLLRLLLDPGEKAIALIGASGVGKSTVAHQLVYRILEERTPQKLRTRPVYFVDSSRLVATDGFSSDWQRQCLDVLKECEDSDVIWYLGSLLPLLDAGKHIYSDYNIALLLRPFFAAKRVTVIGECSDKDWAKLELRDAAFARCFLPYRLQEPNAEVSREILEAVARELHQREKIEITEGAIAACSELCRRYVSEGSASGTAIHFLRRLVDAHGEKSKLDRSDAISAFSGETGLPELLLRDDLVLDPGVVERAFTKRLVGQEEAVRRMVDLVSVIKSGLSDLSKPLASFLFVGPTGVGKTETAKALAAFLFGGDHRLLRFDMSEYVAYDAVHRFLGNAREEGKLVQAVRARPFSVVLLDEIEKAHPAIFDVLLQVLGEARLTDESGRLADFRNTVVVMTSNLGVESLRAQAGFSQHTKAYHAHFKKEAERFFRPELMNRIDHVIAFSPLERTAIEQIAHRELDKLKLREGFAQRDLRLKLDEKVPGILADRGTDLRYGARPLKRTIEKMISLPLARALSGRAHQGSVVRVVPEAGTFTFDIGESTSSAAVRGPIHERIKELELMRYRADVWMNSRDYVELCEDLRLVEQLAKNPRFWSNREAAEKRMSGIEDKRRLRAAFVAARERIIGAEDVAYQAFHKRNPDALPLIDAEMKLAKSELSEHEAELYGRRFDPSDRALLCLEAARGSTMFMRALVITYLELAIEMGWEVDVYLAKDQSLPKPAKAPRPKKDGKDDGQRLKEVKRNERRTILWKKEATLELTKAGDEPPVPKRWLAENTVNVPDAYALVFRGARTAAFLSQETGLHLCVEANESSQVKVIAFPSRGAEGGIPHPDDLETPERLRTQNENKHLVLDHRLKINMTLEPRLARIYRRLMHAGMYSAVFRGFEAQRLFEAFERE